MVRRPALNPLSNTSQGAPLSLTFCGTVVCFCTDVVPYECGRLWGELLSAEPSLGKGGPWAPHSLILGSSYIAPRGFFEWVCDPRADTQTEPLLSPPALLFAAPWEGEELQGILGSCKLWAFLGELVSAHRHHLLGWAPPPGP